jgi:septal ring factor EnvC (AmiA/AmiB activator)
MSAAKETQVEDSPEMKKENPIVPEPKLSVKKKAKNAFQKALPWMVVAVVFFIVGAGLIFFTAYHSTNNELQAAKADAAQLTDKLSASEVDLQTANTKLAEAQASLSTANTSLEKSQMLAILYKFQSDVNAARASLLALDPSSARQFMTLVSADLQDLSKTGIDTQTLSGLQPRIDTAMQNLESNPQTALDALNTLYTNLAIITGNMK